MRAPSSRKLAAAFALLVLPRLAAARQTAPGASDADVVCWGPTSFEDCVDKLGDVTPTTDNTQTSATSALRWSAVYGVEFYGDGSFLTGIPSSGSIVGVYLPLAGGTLTGGLIGTSANFSSFTGASTGLTGISGITGLGVQAQALNLGTHQINAVVDPSLAQDAATKNYVDSNVATIPTKSPARVVATSALPSNAYANGTAGVGATLTGLSIGVLTVDSVALAVGDRILVNGEATAANNGIYVVTTNSGLVVYVLTRTTDHNTPAEMPAGSTLLVDSGTVNMDSYWAQVASVTAVGNSNSPVNFVQTNGASNIIAGTGIVKAGNTLSVNQGTGFAFTASTFSVGGSSFAVSGGSVSVAYALTVGTGLTASSGTFTATGAGQFSLALSSGMNVAQGDIAVPNGCAKLKNGTYCGGATGDVTQAGNNGFTGNNTHSSAGSETFSGPTPFTVGTSTGSPVLVLTSTVVAGGNIGTSVNTFVDTTTVSANSLKTPGDVLRIEFWATTAASGGATRNVQILVKGVSIITSQNIGSADVDHVSCDIAYLTATTNVVLCESQNSTTPTPTLKYTAGTFDATTDWDIKAQIISNIGPSDIIGRLMKTTVSRR